MKISKQFLILYAVLGIFIILTSTYSIITPAFEGPDESTHFTVIENFKEGKFLEEDFRKENLLPLPHMIYSLFLQFFDYDKTDIPANWPVRIVKDSEVHNRFLHFDEENFPFSGTASAVHFLRFISIGCGIGVLLFTFKISRFIFPNSALLSLIPVAFLAFIPKFIFIFSVINSEVFFTLFAVLAIFFLFKFVKDSSSKNLVLMAIFNGLALFSKINSLLLIIIFAIIFILFFKKFTKTKIVKSISLFIVISIISGGWYKIFKNIYTDEIQNVSTNPLLVFGEPTRPQPTLSDINYRLFESIWTELGWGGFKVVTVDGFLIFIWSIILISISGIVLLLVKRKDLLSHNVDRLHYIILITMVVVFISGLAYTVFVYNGGNGRNVLAALPFICIGFTLGFQGIFGKNKKLLYIIPISILLVYGISHVKVIEEDLGYDFGVKYPYSQILMGHGTNEMGSVFTAIQHGFLEGGQEGIYLFLHPNNDQTWWNYTIPIDEKFNTLKYYYGFAVSPIRSLPVEFSVYVNGEKVFSDKKYYTCTLGYFEKNLEKYKGDDVEISLATDGLGDNYAAWAIWKPVLDDEELFLIKPTHPEISKTWVSSEYDLPPCES